jgi:hypothetical protein
MYGCAMLKELKPRRALEASTGAAQARAVVSHS